MFQEALEEAKKYQALDRARDAGGIGMIALAYANAEQKEKARGILVQRRDKFLALVDSSPPPSLTLSRLAPLAQRLGEPKKSGE